MQAHAVGDNPTAAVDAPLSASWMLADIGTPPPTTYTLGSIERTVSGDVIATDEHQTIMCWNGTAWTTIPRPDIPATQGAPIGAYGGVSCSDFFLFDTQDAPLRWHWNGQAWTSAPTGTKYEVRDFKAFAADDMVAIDAISGQGLRFDGTAWRSFPLPANLTYLHAIGGTSSRDLWLFGDLTTSWDFGAFRWNGTAWTRTPTPASYVKNGAREVVTVSSDEIYVVDYRTTGGYLRWNGTSWQHAAITTGDPYYVNGAAVVGGTLWVGVSYYTLRLDNGVWSRVDLPAGAYDRTYVTTLDMAVDPRTGTLFAGGSVGGERYPQGLVLRFQP
ncbi:hypothetical protein [Yinghuangia sp. YIM S09857]|uniref:hypothetical protein n=1 Tax=Yinghuangia sp. YIM S09857 TaxID=3436929 RepID=UPI003F53881A